MFKYNELYETLLKMGYKIYRNIPLSEYTTFKIGGLADLFVEVEEVSQLASLIKSIKNTNIPFFIMGNGSNLLVSDDGFRGIVIKLSGNLNNVKLMPNGRILCGCGISLAKICVFALQNSLSGLEFAWGIPGSCGGAIYMNAGAYGSDMSNLTESVTFMMPDGKTKTLLNENLDFSYRKSLFIDKNYILLSAVLKLIPENHADIQSKMYENIKKRKSKQPLDFPNCGSVFKRPGNGYFAGSLIEQCGLKGKSFGGAMVSTKHAGFIVNTGNATCTDVANLIKYIKKSVYENFGVLLECEVKTLGNVNL